MPNFAVEPLCWVSDDDVDYLELEIEFGEGLRVQRHLLLARHDRFLLLADAVLSRGRRRFTIAGCSRCVRDDLARGL